MRERGGRRSCRLYASWWRPCSVLACGTGLCLRCQVVFLSTSTHGGVRSHQAPVRFVQLGLVFTNAAHVCATLEVLAPFFVVGLPFVPLCLLPRV